MPFSELSGKAFRDLRESLGWSQSTLADYLGVNYRTVGRWELGQTRIPRVYELTMRQLVATSLVMRPTAHQRPRAR